MMLPLRDALAKGMLGELLEVEVRLACRTPWELWPFLEEMEHVEVLLHSIHYLDWIRSILGNPSGAYSHAVTHPRYPRLKDARNSIILAYDKPIRCSLSLNHTFYQGPRHQTAEIRVEGERGAGVMSNLQRYSSGEDPILVTSVEDAFGTMAVVDACITSHQSGAVPIALDS